MEHGEVSPSRDLGCDGDMARLRGGATNNKEMMVHHVLEVGLDVGSPLVRGIEEGIIVENKI